MKIRLLFFLVFVLLILLLRNIFDSVETMFLNGDIQILVATGKCFLSS